MSTKEFQVKEATVAPPRVRPMRQMSYPREVPAPVPIRPEHLEAPDSTLPQISNPLEGRRVLVDGANVALAVRRQPSFAAVFAVIRAAVRAGARHDDIDVLFDSSFRGRLNGKMLRDFRAAEASHRWRQAPSGTPADELLLFRAAADLTAVVVSNDCFRDHGPRFEILAMERRLRVDVSARDVLLLFPPSWAAEPVLESYSDGGLAGGAMGACASAAPSRSGRSRW